MKEEITQIFPQIPTSVEIIDCTLRDGEQTPGVWFTLEEKLELAKLLSEAGVDVLDAGFPAGKSGDLEALQEMRNLGLNVSIGATARPLKKDVAAAEESGADEVFLFMPTSDFRLQQTLGISRAQASMVFREGAEEVVSRGMGLNLVFEDVSRSKPHWIITLCEELKENIPINRLVLCDTVGATGPAMMERLIGQFYDAFHDDIRLCTHCHNDFGMATANTVAGVMAGARAVTCTVNGIGERAGNADIAEVVATLEHIYHIGHNIKPKYLPVLSALVERYTGIFMSPLKAVTGFNVYRHESGIHVDGMLKERKSYEFLPASWIEKNSQYILGKHSGSALIRHILSEASISFDEDLVNNLLKAVKSLTVERSKVAHYETFHRLQKFQQEHLSGIDVNTVLHKARLAKQEVTK